MQKCKKYHLDFINKLLFRYNYIVHGCVIPAGTKFGTPVRLNHGGLGIVLHERSVFGDNVVISHYVSVMGASGKKGVPRIGNNVFIGSRAMIVGDVEVGDFVIIGAGAVVTKDIPAYSVVAGMPAKVIKKIRPETTPEEIWRGVYR